jgi:hypothetical protein
MASLIPDSTKTEFATVLSDHFDTFKRTITVHREPIKSVTDIQNNALHGYGDAAENGNISYITQKKEFNAIVSYNNNQAENSTEVGTLEAGTVKIKVQQDAADYIKGGKVEKIEVDGQTFNKVSDDKVQNYLGAVFYIFYLRATT